MTENFKYEGEWFLPSDKDIKVNGILTYNKNEGCSLSLFDNSLSTLLSVSMNIDIIQGVTSDRKNITLYKCRVTKLGNKKVPTDDSTKYQIIECRIQYILEGVLIDSTEDLIFQKVTSEIYNFDEWVGISGFPEPFSQDKTNDYTFEIKYKLPETIAFPIKDGLVGQFEFQVKPIWYNRFQKSMSLSQKVEFVLMSELGLTLKDSLDYIKKFQNFLVLSLYDKSYPMSISLFSDKFFKVYDNGIKLKDEIKMYFSVPYSNNVSEPKYDLDMFFCYNKIKDKFPSLIKRWFDIYDNLQPALSILFDQFFNTERFSDNNFLNLAQAVETFHARLNNHKKMPKAEYKLMVKSICEATPTIYKEWIKEQLVFGNELNLHTRLMEIMIKYSNPFLDKAIGDAETFVNQIKWSRNYYTHYSTDGEKKALRGYKLYDLTSKLKLLLVCAIFCEIGIDKDKIEASLMDHEYSVMNYYSITFI
jgi:hypothetical protein